MPLDSAELAELRRDLPLEGRNDYGHPALIERIGREFGVDPHRVVLTQGTSQANFLAMAAVLPEGGTVVVEAPGYEPLERTAAALGARIRREPIDGPGGLDGFVERVARALRQGQVSLVVLSDLQNPTGLSWGEDRLHHLHDAARAGGGWLLVDEVYLAFRAAAGLPVRPSALGVGERCLATNSLTKVFGLGALRIGWCLVPPGLEGRCWDTQHVLGAVGPFVSEEVAARLWCDPDRWSRLCQRAFAQVEANRKTVAEFLVSNPEVEMALPEAGSVGWARLRATSPAETAAHLEQLRAQEGVVLTPGRFFGRDGQFRVGWGAPTERVAGALSRWSDFLARRRTP